VAPALCLGPGMIDTTVLLLGVAFSWKCLNLWLGEPEDQVANWFLLGWMLGMVPVGWALRGITEKLVRWR
jgi:hypothetical protein